MNQLQLKNSPAVAFNRVSLERDGKVLSTKISYRLYPGQVHGVYGPNACGKTTFVKAAVGIVRREVVDGSIEWFGNSISPDHPGFFKKIGYQPQGIPVFQSLTVAEQLMLVAVNRCANLNDAINALEQSFQDHPILLSRRDARTGVLNGGCRRVLSIATACVGLQNGLLVLDEPTNDLSPQATVELANCLGCIAHRDNNAIIAISHDLAFLKSVSGDRCYAFNELNNLSRPEFKARRNEKA